MPPIIKDSETLTATQETARSGSAPASPNDSAVKPQPVALEIPITVNGARTIEGSDKREPFSETTKTVMVHGSGAVIRLNSAMAPGQLLFLTNERTKKEVVCQVVKSKNYRNVSGYVELEFTEPAVGFWGMRFPGDRIGPSPQAAPARPVAQKTEQPAATSSPSTVVPKPSVSVPVASKPVSTAIPGSSGAPGSSNSATLPGAPKSNSRVPTAPPATSQGSDDRLVEPWLKKREPAARIPAAPPRVAPPAPPVKTENPGPSLPAARSFESTGPSDKAAALFAPTEAPSNPVNVGLSNLTPFFEVKSAPPDTPQPPALPKEPAASEAETEDLKQHTARLQEQLSKMQFDEPVASSPVKPEPVKPEAETPAFPLTEQAISAIKTELVHESAVELIEKSEAPTVAPVLPEPVLEEPAKETPLALIPALETLPQEEMKIPAWLEPLARNASAPSSTQELVLREKAKRKAEQPHLAEVTAPLVAPARKESVAESRVPQFGSALPFEEPKRARESSPRKSGKGMLVAALAAGVVLLAGGGWWYMNQQAAGAHASASAAEAPAVSAASSPKEAAMGTLLPTHENAAASPTVRVSANSNAPINAGKNLPASAPASSATAARNPQVVSSSLKGGSPAASVATASPEVVPEEVKKPVLGEVHLAAPKISQKRTAQATTEPDAGISLSEDQPEANADSLGAGLGIANNQPAAPAAPVPVGGDVKQAKLISSVPPEYPSLAKAQHVSGGVTIDALIDATGHVTKMKVISGPTLLHQAAMDALKQWKYQPAMLDGKPVPMHLSVTIQFRLQ
jgi:TonB family protein